MLFHPKKTQKKHTKKALQKKKSHSKRRNTTKPDVFAFLAYTLILFFGATILVNINPDSNIDYKKDWNKAAVQEMEWIFFDKENSSYLISSNLVNGAHGSAPDFSFLLPQEILEKTEHGAAPDIDFSSIPDVFQINETGAHSMQMLAPLVWDKIEDRSLFVNLVLEYLINGSVEDLPEGAVKYILLLYQSSDQARNKLLAEATCMTPRGYPIDHGQSVLAYQQRADIPGVCKVERRVCLDGKLAGSFIQQHCEEQFGTVSVSDTYVEAVKYKKSPIVSYNTFVPDEYIQPPKDALNADADFRADGKLLPEDAPKLIPGAKNDPIVPEDPEVALNPNLRSFCLSPWGERVDPGQFVKAYRHQNGFTDIPCKVQLRLCVDGELEGSYYYPSCQHWDTSYEDFSNGYFKGDQPSPQRLLKMLDADLEPELEYGNNLAPEIIDRMLKILRE